MGLCKEVKLDNDVTIKYIRIEFMYIYNTRGSKKIFLRAGLYMSDKATKVVEDREYSYSFDDLGYTGCENVFLLIYTKLKEIYPDAIDLM